MTLPLGTRQDIITWSIIDRTGSRRGQGMTEEQARAACAVLADDVAAAPVKLQRVTYVAFTHREYVETFGEQTA